MRNDVERRGRQDVDHDSPCESLTRLLDTYNRAAEHRHEVYGRVDAHGNELNAQKQEIDRITKTLFYGNGEKSIMVRLSGMEQAIADTRKIKWAVMVMAATFVGDIVARLVHL